MRKALIVLASIGGMALTGCFLFQNLGASDHSSEVAKISHVAESLPTPGPGVAKVFALHGATSDVTRTASGSQEVATGAEVHRSPSPESSGWKRPASWQEYWPQMEPLQRVDFLATIEAQADQLATEGDPFSEPERARLHTMLIEAASLEQNPAVLLKLLPVLAVQERGTGEPILTTYLDNATFTAEVRATAAEILVKSGWWSIEQLQQWLDDPRRAADERAAILDELADTLQAWAQAHRPAS